MPQMSPLSWSMLMMTFSLLILITLILTFFFSPAMNKADLNSWPTPPISNETPLKWMW